ncbi:MAG: dihydrofolate reductase family protein [Glycocaulis sp.]
MATIYFGMNQSLDGYIDHEAFAPGEALFRHFIDEVASLAGSIYGRRLYEIMAYWDNDDPDWTPEQHAFADAWRHMPKWVASRSLNSVGPNATLISGDVEAALRKLKGEVEGVMQLGGPDLAHSLAGAGLIDEYRLYLRPYVLGSGKPFFAGPLPPLRLVASDPIGEDALRLTYVPA